MHYLYLKNRAGQILLNKDQLNNEHVLEVYNVAQQKHVLDHNIVNFCLSHYARYKKKRLMVA
jgi:hypothetical protein